MNILESINNFDYIWFLSWIFSVLTFETFLKILAVYFFIVWIAIIVWVTKDIINRTNNIFYQIFSILTVLILTPLWIVIYLLIRPSRTLFEQFYEDAQIDEDADLDLDIPEEKEEIKETKVEEKCHCPKCNYEVREDYKFCPNCRTELKKECIKCWKEIKAEWNTCPFCWEEQEKKKRKKSEELEIVNEKKEEENDVLQKIEIEIKQ
jgi:hypothetical protein